MREIAVLIVDDDPIVRFIHKRTLEKINNYHFTIREAENGSMAIGYFASLHQSDQWPELVLLDIDMPLMSGLEFLCEFRKLPITPAPHVVIVSSSERPEDKIRAESLGVKYFLTKPLSAPALAVALLDHFA